MQLQFLRPTAVKDVLIGPARDDISWNPVMDTIN